MPIKVKIWYRKDRKKWFGLYRLAGRRHAKAFDTKADAEKWQIYTSHQLNHESWQGMKSIEWPLLVELYLAHKQAQGIKPKTMTEIVNSLDHFAAAVGDIPSDRFDQAHLDLFVRRRMAGVKPRTVNKDLESLRALYLWAMKYHYVNPGLEFHMLKTTKKAWRPPDQTRLANLFRRASELPPLYVRMVLAVATGLRRSAIERIGLSESDPYHIDLEHHELVTAESKVDTEYVKPLGDHTMSVVLQYLADLPAGTTQMFPQPWDGKVRFTWERIRREAGLPKLTFHQLRNLSVSILADKGESAAVLQRHAGHKSYKTTEGYVGVNRTTEKRVSQAIDEVLSLLVQ